MAIEKYFKDIFDFYYIKDIDKIELRKTPARQHFQKSSARSLPFRYPSPALFLFKVETIFC